MRHQTSVHVKIQKINTHIERVISICHDLNENLDILKERVIELLSRRGEEQRGIPAKTTTQSAYGTEPLPLNLVAGLLGWNPQGLIDSVSSLQQ